MFLVVYVLLCVCVFWLAACRGTRGKAGAKMSSDHDVVQHFFTCQVTCICMQRLRFFGQALLVRHQVLLLTTSLCKTVGRATSGIAMNNYCSSCETAGTVRSGIAISTYDGLCETAGTVASGVAIKAARN